MILFGTSFCKENQWERLSMPGKNCQKWVLNLGQNRQNSYFPIFYYIKILTKIFENIFLLIKGKKGVKFLMKTDSKHQWKASVSMADSNYHQWCTNGSVRPNRWVGFWQSVGSVSSGKGFLNSEPFSFGILAKNHDAHFKIIVNEHHDNWIFAK